MIKLICEQCGKEFYISPSRLNRLKCCSKKCSNLRKKKTQSGKNNPFYGKKHSPEAIEKNRKAHLGQKSWNKGKIGVYSKETLQKIRFARGKQIGEKHPRWNGGIRMNNGYRVIYSPNHPFKSKSKIVSEHRLIMEKHLGRFLNPQEVVHHKNGIKTDNRIENLILFDNNSEHMLYHGKTGTIKGRPKKIKQKTQMQSKLLLFH